MRALIIGMALGPDTLCVSRADVERRQIVGHGLTAWFADLPNAVSKSVMKAFLAWICSSALAQSCPALAVSGGYQEILADTLLSRTAAIVKRAEPSWRFTSGVCDCEPVFDEIEAVAGTWEHSRDGRDGRVVVLLHRSRDVESASRWMAERARARLLRIPAWTVATSELADGAYLSTYRGGERYDLTFRKGRLIVGVGGNNRTDVERFANYVLVAISEIEIFDGVPCPKTHAVAISDNGCACCLRNYENQDLTPTAPDSCIAAISESLNPASRRTTTVCSPSCGARRRTSGGVSLILSGEPSVRRRPSVG